MNHIYHALMSLSAHGLGDTAWEPAPLSEAEHERLESIVSGMDLTLVGLMNGVRGTGQLLSSAAYTEGASEIGDDTLHQVGWMLATVAELMLATKQIGSNAKSRLKRADQAAARTVEV